MSDLISIIILCRNKAPYTRLCLESLLRSQGARYEIIVVDNGSTDQTPQVLAEIEKKYGERGIDFRVLRNPENIGCSTARNQGTEAAQGNYLAFLDNDAAVRDMSWMPGLRQALEEDDRHAIIGPKLVFPFPPYDIECAGCAVSPNGLVGYLGRGQPKDDPRFNSRQEVQCLISACILTRKKLIQELGGFDEAFNPVQYEDIDLCYRARSQGYRVIYEPSVEMYHFENVTTDGLPDLNFRYLVIKHGMLFKQRWRHMFEQEGGPPDEELKWQELPRKGLPEVGQPPLIDSM